MTGGPCAAGLPEVSPERLARFRSRVAKERIPLTGTLELTRRCGLRCLHCYLDEGDRAGRAVAEEMSAEEACRIVREAAEAGCLNLAITGGDPLLRQDFLRVYRSAREAGILVTVFTNATTLADEIIALFQELPPAMVEVSLYGATTPVYEAVTGVPGSHARCLDGLRRLREAGVRVGLKTMILATNAAEVPAIRALAAEWGARFRVDPILFPRLDGGFEPLAERVPPREAAELELADPARRARLGEFFDRNRTLPPSGTAFECAAGVSAFHVDADGGLRPCLTLTEVRTDAKTSGFREAWSSACLGLDALRSPGGGECGGCELRSLCGRCPGLSRLEAGDVGLPVPYLCDLGGARREILEATREGQGARDAA